MIDLILQVYNECKGKDVICGFYNFIQPAFVVIDPDLAKNILIKDFNNFVNRGTYVNEEDEPLSGKKSYLFYLFNYHIQIPRGYTLLIFLKNIFYLMRGEL